MKTYIYLAIIFSSCSISFLHASIDEAQVCEELYWGARKSHKESLLNLQKRADEGSGFGQAYLSSVHANGFCGLKKSKEESNKYAIQSMPFIEEEAKHGNKYALSRLATFFEFGRGVTSDVEKAFQLHLQAAEDNETPGNSLSKYSIGRMYQSGRKSKNNHEALKWYESAQNALGFYHAGEIYCYNHEVGIDYRKAYECFRKAAYEGLPEAYSDLGVMHFFGRGVPVDYVEAYKLYRKAEELNVRTMWAGLEQIRSIGSSYFKRAQELEKGEKDVSNMDEAIKLYTIAAKLDNSNARVALDRLRIVLSD